MSENRAIYFECMGIRVLRNPVEDQGVKWIYAVHTNLFGPAILKSKGYVNFQTFMINKGTSDFFMPLWKKRLK